MLNRMNGWQRLWFVGTCLGTFLGLGYAYIDSVHVNYNSYHWDLRSRVESELNNEECLKYKLNEMDKLPHLFPGSTCWSLNLSRVKYPGPTPYTIANFDAGAAEDWRERWLFDSAFLLALVGCSSGLVYLAGFLVAWIRRGFR